MIAPNKAKGSMTKAYDTSIFVERRFEGHAVELWRCRWEYADALSPRKIYLGKICDEQPLAAEGVRDSEAPSAVCWSYGRTLGNIGISSPRILEGLSERTGDKAQLPCDFVHAGKFRHGPERWWCRTHQSHWGTKTDLDTLSARGEMLCANHNQGMNYVVSPLIVNLSEYAEVGVWCSMPTALSSDSLEPRSPRIHVHVRMEANGPKTIDEDFAAASLIYNDLRNLFGATETTRVDVTPPAAFEFVRALEAGREMDCISCPTCGHPHLDLGDFAKTPHRKHFCENCGRDGTWSTKSMVSTPLKPLHDQFAKFGYEESTKILDLDQYPNCKYDIWASTPAVVWTAKRPQQKGIHVHVHDVNGNRIIDETFGVVTLEKKRLKREELIDKMFASSIV
jgi:hypothetical protein